MVSNKMNKCKYVQLSDQMVILSVFQYSITHHSIAPSMRGNSEKHKYNEK